MRPRMGKFFHSLFVDTSVCFFPVHQQKQNWRYSFLLLVKMAVSSSSSSSSFSVLVLLFVVVLLLFLPYASVDSSSSHLSQTFPAHAALPSLSHNLRHKSIAKLTTASPAVGRQKPNLAVFSYGASSAVIGEQWGNETGEELLGNGQMLASVPDLSDPCFRRYANSIIVNAQPFERRSSISLINCKVQCLRSPVGVYSCRSFVYDNLNQVCDLFAHVGDQSPAKLLRFKTRDYFEPTAAIHCALDGNEPLKANVPLSPVAPPLMGISIKSPLSSPGDASFSTMFPLPPSPVPPHLPMKAPQTTPPVMIGPSGEQTDEEEPARQEPGTVKGKEDGPGKAQNGIETVGTATGEQPKECTASQVPRFLRTMDFELFGFDESRIGNVRGAEECASACINKRASNGAGVKCHSFEFTAARSDCTFSAESAVPLGNGQLRQRPGTDYFEHICVDRLLANQCQPSVVPGFRRFPQMILVGFAETVVDSPSLQECFDNCLNSRQLYGFVCSSGMFYFEEPQLNCILNTEDRKSQPELFTSETSDLVDYFETGCSAGNRTIGASNGGRQRDDGMSLRKQDFVGPRRHREPVPKTLEASTTTAALPSSTSSHFPPVPSFSSYKGAIWTGWTRCAGKGRWTTIGIQMRQKICGPRLCGKEERQCNLVGTTPIDGDGLRKGTEGTKSAVPRGESRRRDFHPPAVGHYSPRGRMPPALLSFLWRRRR